MPCKDYESEKQRRACFATENWKKPVKKLNTEEKRDTIKKYIIKDIIPKTIQNLAGSGSYTDVLELFNQLHLYFGTKPTAKQAYRLKGIAPAIVNYSFPKLLKIYQKIMSNKKI